MAASEGFRRITTLGRRTAIGGALLLFVGFFINLWATQLSDHRTPDAAGPVLVPGFFLLIIGVLLLLAGWIGDGFVASRDSDSLPRG
jgi:hypothetical protein